MASPRDRFKFEACGTEVELIGFEDTLRYGCEDVTGFVLWRAATTAALRTLKEEKALEKSVFLELGSGLGALGCLSLKQGASFGVFTDKELPVLRLTQGNAELNGCADRAECVCADFTAERLPFRRNFFDVQIASDVLFWDGLAAPLLRSLAGDEANPAKLSIVGHEIRRAVYRGPDGQPKLEDEDSALRKFVDLAKTNSNIAAVEERYFKSKGPNDTDPEVSSAAIVLRGPEGKEVAEEQPAKKQKT